MQRASNAVPSPARQPAPILARPWLMALPLTAALGTYFLPMPVAGLNIYGFRSLVILSFPLTALIIWKFYWLRVPAARYYVFVGWLWLLWGSVSVAWAPARLAAAKEVAEIAFGFCAGLTLLNLQPFTITRVRWLRDGWVLGYLATSAVALWELTTGHHLPSHYTETAPDYLFQVFRVAAATFGHPNNYAAFLVLCFPFLAWSLSEARHTLSRFVYILLLGALPLLVAMTASRVGLVALLCVVLFWAALRGKATRTVLVASSLIGFAAIAYLPALHDTFLIIAKLESLLGEEIARGGSASNRMNLTLNGLWFLLISGGIGTGAGSFETMIAAGAGPLPTRGIINPHNFWIEVLSQYGLVVFCVFVMWLGYIGCIAWRARARAEEYGQREVKLLAEVVLCGLVAYCFAALANSAYVGRPINWMFLGSLGVLSTCLSLRAYAPPTNRS